jgi:hypothetical protein
MKNRGQVFVIVVFVVLIIILGLSFYFYYFGLPEIKLTGETVKKKVTLVEKESLADNLLVPEILSVYAPIGKDSREEFQVSNYNAEAIKVSCNFPPFQEGVPSSRCFTYDSDGNFVGLGEVRILPGKSQTFMASVTPFDNIRVRKNSRDISINIQEGEYTGEIELQAYTENDEKKTVSVITIPVRIFVED